MTEKIDRRAIRNFIPLANYACLNIVLKKVTIQLSLMQYIQTLIRMKICQKRVRERKTIEAH